MNENNTYGGVQDSLVATYVCWHQNVTNVMEDRHFGWSECDKDNAVPDYRVHTQPIVMGCGAAVKKLRPIPF
jgi:hypothetical protein